MSGLLIGVLVAIAATLLLLLRPFLPGLARSRATASHKQLNAAIHRDQMAELERDRAAGTLTEEDYRQALAELQRRVLEDGQGDEAPPVLKAPRKTFIALALMLPAASIALYVAIGNPAGVQPAAQQRMSAQDIDRMVASLAEKMAQDPKNVEGWTMLARSYKMLGRVDEAEKALEHLISINGQDAQAYADYADVLVMKAGGKFEGKPQQMIDKALKLDPDNLQALWLAGTAAYAGGRYPQAIARWSRLQGLLPPESEDTRQIAGAIEDARAKAGAAKGRGSGKQP